MLSRFALIARPSRFVTAALVIAATASSALVLPVGLAGAETSPLIQSRSKTAACAQWNVTGTWGSSQGNGFSVKFILKQHGIKLSGTSINPPSSSAALGYTTGKLTGTVKGDHLNLVTHWQKSTVSGISDIGNYYGKVSARHITGLARDLAVGVSHAHTTWLANGKARCTKTKH